MYYIINAVLGASVAIFIAWLSRTNMYVLAGLVPFFPTFGLFAHILAFQQGGADQTRHVIAFGLISIIPILLYLCAMYFTVDKMKFSYAVSLSLFVWTIAALQVYFFARKFMGV